MKAKIVKIETKIYIIINMLVMYIGREREQFYHQRVISNKTYSDAPTRLDGLYITNTFLNSRFKSVNNM